MARVKLHPFQAGLYLNGPRQLNPEGSLRRARGLASFRTPTLRSRQGSVVDTDLTPNSDVHSIFRFSNSTYSGVGAHLYNGLALLKGGLNGNPLAFVKAPATNASDFFLYVAGGGELFKTKDGITWSTWGLDPPSRGSMVVKRQQYYGTRIVRLSTAAPGYSDAPPDYELWSVAPINASYSAGLAGLRGTVGTDKNSAVDWSTTENQNLTFFTSGGVPSFEGDYIALQIRLFTPANVDTITLFAFTDSDNYFQRTLHVKSAPSTPEEAASQEAFSSVDRATLQKIISGQAIPAPTLPWYLSNQRLSSLERTRIDALRRRIDDFNKRVQRILDTLQVDRFGQPLKEKIEVVTTPIGGASDVNFGVARWRAIKVAKNTWEKVGSPVWSNITHFRIAIRTNTTGSCIVDLARLLDGIALPGGAFDDLALIGGSPLVGTYKYQITNFEPESGTESNPLPEDESIGKFATLATPLVTPGSTSLDVDDASEFPENGVIEMGGEFRRYTGKVGNTLTGLTVWHSVFQHQDFTGGTTVTVVNPLMAPDVDRHPVGVFLIPDALSADHQIRVYRTIGNQEDLFRTQTLNFGENTISNDVIADFAALEPNRDVIGIENILFDNIKPDATFDDAVGIFQGRMWWARNSNANASNSVYYSPPGRYEAVKSSIEVTHSEDTVQKIVIWNGALFAITQHAVVQIYGETEPFLFRTIAGAPGTLKPFTVIPTPYGIAYQAQDGVRLFNGQEAPLLGFDALAPLFRGLATEDWSGFSGDKATYARDEYIITDTEQNRTLCYSFLTQSWREMSLGSTAWFYDPRTDNLLCGSGPQVIQVEKPGAEDDDPNPIAFAVETRGVTADSDATLLVQRIYIEANANGQVLTPYLILDNSVLALPPFTGTEMRYYEYSLNRTGRIAGVRITGTISKPVEIARIEMDIHQGRFE